MALEQGFFVEHYPVSLLGKRLLKKITSPAIKSLDLEIDLSYLRDYCDTLDLMKKANLNIVVQLKVLNFEFAFVFNLLMQNSKVTFVPEFVRAP